MARPANRPDSRFCLSDVGADTFCLAYQVVAFGGSVPAVGWTDHKLILRASTRVLAD